MVFYDAIPIYLSKLIFSIFPPRQHRDLGWDWRIPGAQEAKIS